MVGSLAQKSAISKVVLTDALSVEMKVWKTEKNKVDQTASMKVEWWVLKME
jgi:hypothetical protein